MLLIFASLLINFLIIINENDYVVNTIDFGRICYQNLPTNKQPNILSAI